MSKLRQQGSAPGLGQGTSALLLLCWGGICSVFGKREAPGDEHRAASQHRYLESALHSPISDQTDPYLLHPVPAKSVRLPGRWTGTWSCTHESLGTGEGQRWNEDGGSSRRDRVPWMPGEGCSDPLPSLPMGSFVHKAPRCFRAGWDGGHGVVWMCSSPSA